MSAIHALVHTTGVLTDQRYFALEMSYWDVTGNQQTLQIKSPIHYYQFVMDYPHSRPDAIMSKVNGCSQRDVRQFLQWCYANLQEKLKTPDIVFGYKGPNQRDFLLRHGISNIVDVGTIGVPSLSLLKQLYVPPLCKLHVSPYSKCALAAVQSIATYMVQQNLILLFTQQ